MVEEEEFRLAARAGKVISWTPFIFRKALVLFGDGATAVNKATEEESRNRFTPPASQLGSHSMHIYGDPSGSSKFGEWLRIKYDGFDSSHYRFYFSQKSIFFKAMELVQVTELEVDLSYEMRDV